MKFKNVYPKSLPKPIYTNIKSDALCNTKLKANKHALIYPQGQYSLAILSLDEIDALNKMNLNHNGVISSFNTSHHTYDDELALVVSSCRNDSIVRVWRVPGFEEYLSSEMEITDMRLMGHKGKIEWLSFHSVFSDILASSSSDRTIRLWNMATMTEKISLELPDDSFSQSFCFDYMGERMASITSKSLLQIFDWRTNICALSLETQHSKHKSARVMWLNPDPFVVSTGFDKSSNRTLFLWDIRRMDKSVSESNLGSSFAQIEPIWDSELPLLYLPARNENLAMMELKNGILYQTSIAKMEKTASCLELLPKSLCDTSKCEIARFLRLGSDQSIDTVGIHVPRINSDSVFQQDLYPNYSVISVKDSTSWAAPENLRISTISIGQEKASLAHPIKENKSQRDHSPERFKHEKGEFNALLERKSWWRKTLVNVSLFLRSNIYIADSENNAVLMDVPDCISSFLAYDQHPDRLTFKVKETEYLLQFESKSQVDQFIDALSKRISIQKSIPAHHILAENVQIFDPFQIVQNSMNWKNWELRYMILESDAVLLICDRDTCPKKENLLKVIDLQHLLGIFRIHIQINECPSARVSILPIFVFRLVFSQVNYLVCVKSERQLNLWMESVLKCLENQDFYLPGYCITDPNHIISVEILETVSGTKDDHIRLNTGVNYNLLVLYDSIQFTDDRLYQNSVYLSIGRSCISEMKLINDRSLLLVFNEYSIVKFKISSHQDVASTFKVLKSFISQDDNIPSTIGIHNEDDLKTLMNESICHKDLCFCLDDKSSNSTYLFAFGNNGEMEACIPNSRSIYDNRSYVLETKTELFHWMGPNSKRRIHARALDLAVKIRKYRNMRPKITLVEFDDPKTVDRLFSVLGYFPSIFPPSSGPENIQGDMQLFQINSKARHIPAKMILISKSKKLSKRMLHSEYVYIVLFQNLIFLWCGNTSTDSDKLFGRAVMRRFANLQKQTVPAIGEFIENLEHPMFWEAFDDAGGPLPIQMNVQNEEGTGNIADSMEQKEIDLGIFQSPIVYEEGDKDLKMVDISLFRVSNFRLEPITNSCIFFRSSESYIVLYLYTPPLSGVTKAIIFFWQGSKSAVIEQGAAAMLAIEVSADFKGEISQQRIEEGKESIQFCRLLGGINIIDSDFSFPVAFDVRSVGPDYPCKSYQVSDLGCIPWNINHVILFLNKDRGSIWKGKFSLESEIAYAKTMALKLGILDVKVTDNFDELNLSDLGILNANKPILKSRTTRFKERFFQTLSVTGAVEFFPLNSVNQSDLKNVIVLDDLENIYVWISLDCNSLEITTAIATMQKLILTCSIHQKSKCYVTIQGHEPFDFKAAIHGWKDRLDASPIVKVIPANDYLNNIQAETYPLNALISEPPNHLDRRKLESYLDNESFVSLFQMSREEYDFLPLWKRNHLKKSVGFF